LGGSLARLRRHLRVLAFAGRQNPLVFALEVLHPFGCQHLIGRLVDLMAGQAQQRHHLLRPVLLELLCQELQFPQMVGVAQRVHAPQQPVRLPAVVHQHAHVVLQ
jgi:hypothetical protein